MRKVSQLSSIGRNLQKVIVVVIGDEILLIIGRKNCRLIGFCKVTVYLYFSTIKHLHSFNFTNN